MDRAFLISLAYRMLGSASDAEDLVQETYLRYSQSGETEIRAPRAYLTTILTRLCINHLESARVRREQYIGPWLPEPVITSTPGDPAILAESVTMAFLVLLESLSPLERAVFLLHEVFDYTHNEIAAITGTKEENCRQLLRRAKQAIRERRPRFEPQHPTAENLIRQFGRAATDGNLDGLMDLLHADIAAYSDGGGLRPAALNPIHGKDRVARFLIGIARKGARELQYRFTQLNGQPGVIGFRNGEASTVLVLDIDGERVRAIYIVVNPHKLALLPKEAQL